MSDNSTIIPITIGGTEADAPEEAIKNLLPEQNGAEGLMLASSGDGTMWADLEEVGISISRYLGNDLRTVVSQNTITRQLATKADYVHTGATTGDIAFSWGNHLAANYVKSLGDYESGLGVYKHGWRFNIEYGIREMFKAVEGHHPYLNSRAMQQTNVFAGRGLVGGGDLTVNRTYSINFGEIAGSVAEGDDLRIIQGDLAFKRGDHKLHGYLTLQELLEKSNVHYTAGPGITMSYTPLSDIIGPTPPSALPPQLPGLETPPELQRPQMRMMAFGVNEGPADPRDSQMVPTINLDFGDGPDQVARGDDERFDLIAEAYSWGNPADIDYVRRSEIWDLITDYFSTGGSGLTHGSDKSLNLTGGDSAGTALYADDVRYVQLAQQYTTVNGRYLGSNMTLTAHDIGACECPHHDHNWFDVFAHNAAALFDFYLICGVDVNNDDKSQFPPAPENSMLVTCISDYCITIADTPPPPPPTGIDAYCDPEYKSSIKMNIPNGGGLLVRLSEFSKAVFQWDHEDVFREIDEFEEFEFVDMEDDIDFFGIHSLTDPDTEEPIRYRTATLYYCGGDVTIAGSALTEVLGWDGRPNSIKFYDVITSTSCANLVNVPEEFLPSIIKTDDMFRNSVQFESDISEWDTTEVLSMKRMLLNTPLQVSDISDWCVYNIDEEPILFRTHDFYEYDDTIDEEDQPEFDLSEDPHFELGQPEWGGECW